ncbi:hypothetical protein ONS95_009231 [Cadophora gregata]|uniref:uncharacterized protein n=1 Tax=Cadophora gregata TaxID=51156 RepID=UPI0026DBACB9|nr:uncharacterized protein ONS95_009231 [Cadophora gregata]KAK0124258.1 hypothetical protein ONS95_009231 [Cadophora gregata]
MFNFFFLSLLYPIELNSQVENSARRTGGSLLNRLFWSPERSALFTSRPASVEVYPAYLSKSLDGPGIYAKRQATSSASSFE